MISDVRDTVADIGLGLSLGVGATMIYPTYGAWMGLAGLVMLAVAIISKHVEGNDGGELTDGA